MKIRSIRPEFFADPTMAELDPMARLLYIGLWCYVDDDGRGEWLPKQIDGMLFPLDSVDIHALLEQLVRSARIVRYSDGDREFFYIPTFSEYQKPNRKYDSKLPDPAEYLPSPGGTVVALPTQRARTADAPPVEGEGEVEVEGDIAPQPAREIPGDSATLNDLKAVLVELFGEPPPHNWKLYNRIATWIRDQGGTVDEVRLKAGLVAEEWGRKALTATSLEKYWNRYDAKVGQLSDDDIKRYQAEVRRQRRRKEILDGP